MLVCIIKEKKHVQACCFSKIEGYILRRNMSSLGTFVPPLAQTQTLHQNVYSKTQHA